MLTEEVAELLHGNQIDPVVEIDVAGASDPESLRSGPTPFA